MVVLASCLSENDLPYVEPAPDVYEISLSLNIIQESETRLLSFGDHEEAETRNVSRPICHGELLQLNVGDLYLVTATGTIVRHYAIVGGTGALDPDGSGRLTPANRAQRIIHRNLLGNGRGSGGFTLYAVPSSVTRVVIVGNTLGNPTSGDINSVRDRALDIITQYNALDVNLFGESTLSGIGDTRTATVHLRPSVARVEIGRIAGTQGCIHSFRLDGIFIDNFYRNSPRLDGTQRSDWRANGTAAATFVSGSAAYPAALSPALFHCWHSTNGRLAVNLEVTPGGTSTWTGCTAIACDNPHTNVANVWGFQVFAGTNTRAPRIVVRLRDVDVVNTDGTTTRLPNPQFVTVNLATALEWTGNSSQAVGNISAAGVYHIHTIVFDRGDLNITPLVSPLTSSTGTSVTSFANVLYDFQTHQLETSVTNATGTPTAWQWQVSTDNTEWANIQEAFGTAFQTSGQRRYATWTLPQDFIHNPLYNGFDYLYFRSVITLSDGTQRTSPSGQTLRMRFIRTTLRGEGTGFRRGFGMDAATGVRYAVMARAQQNAPLPETDNTIRVALLNLGATATDGVGLGSLFQWGRRADGHERITWHTNPATNAVTFSGSATVSRNNFSGLIDFNADGQPNNAAENRFFTVASGDWSIGTFVPDPDNTDLWGAGSAGNTSASSPSTRANAPVRSTAWTERAQRNNPCPPGWRVPSRYDWSDMYRGSGTGNVGTSGTPDAAIHNTWAWYTPRSGAVGGVVLTNPNNTAVLFLPAAGLRRNIDGAIEFVNMNGFYWSSSQDSPANAFSLQFSSNNVSAGTNAGSRARGLSVRCVAD